MIMAKAKRYEDGGMTDAADYDEATDKAAKKAAKNLSRALDVKSSDSFSLQPQFAALDKGFKGVGGRLAYDKELDKNSSIRAYADVMAGKAAGQSAFIKPQKVGLEYRRSFAKGGAVRSASARADGIAQRGKTRGKMR